MLFVTNVAFVSPQWGGQAIGAQWIEVTTDARKVDRVEFSVDGVLAGVARKPPYRIAYDFGTSLTPRTITARVFSDNFQHSEISTIRTAAIGATESMNVDVVEVPLRIRSSHVVRSADLRVRENDVDQTIREVKPGRGPAHFVFIIDRSLSMGDGKLDAALHAARNAVPLLRADDSASVVLFNHNVDKPLALDLVPPVAPSGGTSLRDAVASIASADRTYAIVITDGGDRNSILTDEEALRRISGTKTVVCAAVFGSAGSFLKRATNNTGGDLVATTRDNVTRDVRDIITDINSRYVVVYQSHGTKSGWRSITVTPKSRDIRITSARKGYFAA